MPESENHIIVANNRTLEEVLAEYGFPPSLTMKKALYDIHHASTKQRVAVLMRDGDVNPVKLANVFGDLEAVQSDEAEICSLITVKPSFSGPFGALADLKMVADKSLEYWLTIVKVQQASF